MDKERLYNAITGGLVGLFSAIALWWLGGSILFMMIGGMPFSSDQYDMIMIGLAGPIIIIAGVILGATHKG